MRRLSSFLRRAFCARPLPRRRTLAVEALEDRAVPTVAPSFEWSMADRFGIDQGRFQSRVVRSNDHGRDVRKEEGGGVAGPDGRIDLWNDKDFVQAKKFTVQLDASASWADSIINGYRWTIQEIGRASTTTYWGRQASVDLEQRPYKVTLTVYATEGARSVSQVVTVRDILIVSIGDSAASGEGNPDVPRNDDHGAIWADGPDAGVAHRSTKSAAARAALALERSDPHTSVTFVDVTCSGQSLREGVLNPGMWQEKGSGWAPKSQLDQVRDIVGSRTIDTLLVTAGANDLNWSSWVEDALFGDYSYRELNKSYDHVRKFVNPDIISGPWYHNPGRVGPSGIYTPNLRFEGEPLNLWAWYDRLAARVASDLAPRRVVINEYFDMTRDATGAIVPMLGEIIPGLKVSKTEAEWAYNEMLVPLNRQIHAAAARHGWEVVGGIADAFRTHGYPAGDQSWIVTADQSRETQGPYTTPSFGERLAATAGGILIGLGSPWSMVAAISALNLSADEAHRLANISAPTQGMLHPNGKGQEAIANLMLGVLNRPGPARSDVIDLGRERFGNDGKADRISVQMKDGILLVRREPRAGAFGPVEAEQVLLAKPAGDVTSVEILGSNDDEFITVLGSNDLRVPIFVSGGGGQDSLTFRDTNSTFTLPSSYVLTDRQITRDAFNYYAPGARDHLAIDYKGFEKLYLEVRGSPPIDNDGVPSRPVSVISEPARVPRVTPRPRSLARGPSVAGSDVTGVSFTEARRRVSASDAVFSSANLGLSAAKGQSFTTARQEAAASDTLRALTNLSPSAEFSPARSVAPTDRYGIDPRLWVAPTGPANRVHIKSLPDASVSIGLGDAGDTVSIDANSLSAPNGQLTIHGGARSDAVFINDGRSAEAGSLQMLRHGSDPVYTLRDGSLTRSSNTFGWSSPTSPFFGGVPGQTTIHYDGIETLVVNGNNRGNTFNVERLTPGVKTVLNGGTGADRFNLRTPNQRLDDLGAGTPLTIDGFGGGDVLTLDDRGNPRTAGADEAGRPVARDTRPEYTLGDGSVSRANFVNGNQSAPAYFASVTYKGIAELKVLAGDSDDRFVVAAATAGTNTVLDAGGGVDTLDYTRFPGGVAVDLAAGTATALASVSGVEDVISSSPSDDALGDDRANLLAGNGGEAATDAWEQQRRHASPLRRSR